jgi:hypothetical protein
MIAIDYDIHLFQDETGNSMGVSTAYTAIIRELDQYYGMAMVTNARTFNCI